MSAVCCQDEDTEELLSNDFEIGQCLRDQVIPKAVLYFTGEALDYSDVSLSWFLATVSLFQRPFFQVDLG